MCRCCAYLFIHVHLHDVGCLLCTPSENSLKRIEREREIIEEGMVFSGPLLKEVALEYELGWVEEKLKGLKR